MKLDMRWALVVLAALVLAGGSAWAVHHEKGGEKDPGRQGHHARKVEKRDADGDGEISREEWLDAAATGFDRLDADGSGAVSQEEMKAGRRNRGHGKPEKE